MISSTLVFSPLVHTHTQELLKHTPASHPDYTLVEEALGSLHEELVKLNQSIKSCQLVCSSNNRSVRVRFNQSTSNLTRKVKRKGSRKAKRTLAMLKRFVACIYVFSWQ